MPKIFFLMNGHHRPGVAGGDVHAIAMARELQAMKWDVRILAAKSLVIRQTEIPTTITSMAGDLPVGWRLFLDYLLRVWRSIWVLRWWNKFNYDGYFAYATSDHWQEVMPLLFCRARKKVAICHMLPNRYSSLHFRISFWLGHFLFRRLRGKKLMLCINEEIRAQLQRRGLPPEELAICPPGVDLRELNDYAEPERVFDLIWIGRDHPQKGIDDLNIVIRALRKTVADFLFMLVGGGERVRAIANQNGGIWVENISDVAKFRNLKRSRVYLCPSHYESWGSAIAEAICAGCRVVSYDLPHYEREFPGIHTVPSGEVERLWRLAHWQIMVSRHPEKTISRHLMGTPRLQFRNRVDLSIIARRFYKFFQDENAI